MSMMASLEVVANIINMIIYKHWIKHNLGRPNYECERGYAGSVEYIAQYISFSSLCILKICPTFYLCVKSFLEREPNKTPCKVL